MKVLYSPQVNNQDTVEYSFSGERIAVTLNGVTDIFDFSSSADGVVESVETELPINPIVSARRENGVLHVELLYFINADATEEEKFPTWQEV